MLIPVVFISVELTLTMSTQPPSPETLGQAQKSNECPKITLKQPRKRKKWE
jgi:hypothetical protein